MENTHLFKNKKLLILGGSYQHIKIVKAAKKLGVITYVTDFLPIEKSPAKQMADHPLMYNITDIDDLTEFCKAEHIDGIIGPYLDVTQLPYQELCERLDFPCFGNLHQHEVLTNKTLFKDFCKNAGVGVVETYSREDIINRSERVKFPLLVKPCDSRGSRGQTICYDFESTLQAIEYASSFSFNSGVIIEKYMQDFTDLQLVYMVINSEPILVRVEDRYLGSAANGFDKLCIATIDPSRWEKRFREKADAGIKKMIKKLGLKNSPVFIQAFFDGETVLPYDPGIRLPGDDFDDLYKIITGIDLPDILVKFALSGEISHEFIEKIGKASFDKLGVMILPCLKPGKIVSIKGYDELKDDPEFISFSKAYSAGDEVKETRDVRQRFGEFCIVTENFASLKKLLRNLYNNLKVTDENGENMLIELFDIEKIKEYE